MYYSQHPGHIYQINQIYEEHKKERQAVVTDPDVGISRQGFLRELL